MGAGLRHVGGIRRRACAVERSPPLRGAIFKIVARDNLRRRMHWAQDERISKREYAYRKNVEGIPRSGISDCWDRTRHYTPPQIPIIDFFVGKIPGPASFKEEFLTITIAPATNSPTGAGFVWVESDRRKRSNHWAKTLLHCSAPQLNITDGQPESSQNPCQSRKRQRFDNSPPTSSTGFSVESRSKFGIQPWKEPLKRYSYYMHSSLYVCVSMCAVRAVRL